MRMPIWLDKRASLTPNRIAVETKEASLTFKELEEASRAMAAQLIHAGIDASHTIGLLADSDLNYITFVHSIPYIGAKIVLFNHRLTQYELSYQIEDSKCDVLIYSSAYAEISSALQASFDQLRILSIEEIDKPTSAAAHVQLLMSVEDDDVYTIMYTSGTTGHPKGVLQSYKNHFSSAVGSALNLGLHDHDKWLVTMPLFHISGLSVLIRSIVYGITVYFQPKFSPELANQVIIERHVTIMSVVSNMLQRMIEELGDKQYPSTFRCMLLGGGPAPLPLLQSCVNKQIPVVQTYGMTETCSQFATLAPEYMLSKLGSAGKPLFQGELKIMENEQELQYGAAGEIVVSGPNVTSGYLNGVSPESFDGRWFYTGDIGYVDEEGFLYVLDRRKDMMISGGENVYPAEIEAVLLAHPAIEEAGVTGVEDAVWGQSPIAFVVVKQGCELTDNELQLFCSERLAKYKLPKAYYYVDALPRNAANKLMRKNLLSLTEHGYNE